MASPPQRPSRPAAARPVPASKAPVTPASTPPAAAQPTQVVESQPVVEAVEAPVLPAALDAAADPAPAVEAPLQAQAPEPEIKTETETEISTPETTAAADILPVAAVEKKGQTIMNDAMETAKTFAEETKARMQGAFGDLNEKSRAAIEKSTKVFEEFGEITKGNLEAVVESSKIAAKGVEALGQDAAEFGRRSFEKTSATMKSFAAIKTPSEFFHLQSELLSSMMDSFASESAKNSETVLKLVSDITTPLTNRVSVVTEKMKSLAA